MNGILKGVRPVGMHVLRGWLAATKFAVGWQLLVMLWVQAADASPRTWQPLILKGASLPQLLGQRIDRLEVLVVRQGILEPIPFQVDQALPGGSLALREGPEPSADHSSGVLERDDELVMMVSDLGERCLNLDGLAPGALEIEIADPLGGSKRYAYVAAVGSPRLNANGYVHYEPRLVRIETDHYRLAFTHEFPSDLALQSHKYEGRPSMIDGFEVGVRARVLGLFDVGLTENDVEGRALAYRTGPVRVIRRVAHRVRLWFRIRSPEVSTVEFFYRDFSEASFAVRFPPRVLFRDIQGRLAMDFIDLRNFWLLCSGMQQSAVRIGEPAAQHQSLDKPAPNADWVALRGDGRLMLQTFLPTPDLPQVKRQLYYRHGSPASGPSRVDRIKHNVVGTVMTGWENLARGVHRFDPIMISAPDSYNPDLLLKELSTSLLVTVRPALDQPGRAPRLSQPALSPLSARSF